MGIDCADGAEVRASTGNSEEDDRNLLDDNDDDTRKSFARARQMMAQCEALMVSIPTLSDLAGGVGGQVWVWGLEKGRGNESEKQAEQGVLG